MKTNLENFPKSLIDERNDTLGTVPLIKLQQHHNETMLWKRTIEKELRGNLVQSFTDCSGKKVSEGNQLFIKGYLYAIKEFLGE